jgi:cytochrome c oxidase subunit 2
MPIEVKVVSEQEYQDWLTDAKVKFAKEIIEDDKYKKLASK